MSGKKIPFKKIARSITGISTPIFGVSWTPPQDEREIVRKLVIFLEDRRVLYTDYHMEYGPWVAQSVLEIRKELTEALRVCNEKSSMVAPLQAMRAACRKFLDNGSIPGRRLHLPFDAEMLALGELRGVFGLHLATLCASYGIDASEELAQIFPPASDTD